MQKLIRRQLNKRIINVEYKGLKFGSASYGFGLDGDPEGIRTPDLRRDRPIC